MKNEKWKEKKNIERINTFVIIKKLFDKEDYNITNFKKYINNIKKIVLIFQIFRISKRTRMKLIQVH